MQTFNVSNEVRCHTQTIRRDATVSRAIFARCNPFRSFRVIADIGTVDYFGVETEFEDAIFAVLVIITRLSVTVHLLSATCKL